MFDCIYVGGKKICEVHVLIICIIVIILYGQVIERVAHATGPDKLTGKFAKCDGCDYWGVLHTLFFGLLGFLFPNRHLKYIAIGALWEIIEGYIGCVNSGSVFINLFGGWGKITKDSPKRDWYYGRMSDVVFNTIGYSIGSSIRTKYYPGVIKL